ncbi:PAS domain-containing sensor histidine kinase [Pelistega europaea]|uniref:histidine kinase n=1 Tax=Pelistega europaea TaxID=106147 RepID=A0A7Y4P5T8_9BURK|nr:PAS domain-containing sensor histidine kinase [Pelistega europaea]NOL49065.1 PAS domain S-box protein [Pelistega europaea]
MQENHQKNLISKSLNYTTKSRRLHWLAPVFVIMLYIVVMVAFFSLQKIQTNLLPYFVDNNEGLQHLLNVIIIALSVLIIISLFLMWRYTRQRLQTEQALETETIFRRAMENSMSTGMRVIDMQGRIIYVNPAFCRLIGWDESSLIGTVQPYPYWIPGRHKEHMRVMEILLAGKAPSSGIELEVQRRDGSRFTARLYVSPMRNPDGQQIGWMTSMTDITEPKRVREALSAAHERFMTVLESLDDAISVAADTPNGVELLFANRMYRRLFGSQPYGHQELLKQINENRDGTNQYFIPMVNIWFEVHHRTLGWTDGRKVRLQVARDITERLKHEQESRNQQEKIQLTSRLTTMGEMASTLAHELNQPLTAIVNYNTAAISLLKTGKADADKIIAALEKSATQAERAGKIISRIRAFVKRSDPRRQQAHIESIVANTLDLAEIDARKHGKQIESYIEPNLPNVYADPILIEQVLLNLIKNGLEAMTQSESKIIKVHIARVGKEVEVSVIDRGHGLKEPERLFEPFFSTKTEGLGMGLNICRTIIESHHGQLWAEHNPEGGTIFKFRLPLLISSTIPSSSSTEKEI